MGRAEDPVLAYLDDQLAALAGIREWLSILSYWLDEDEAINIAVKIRDITVRCTRETIERRLIHQQRSGR